MKRKQLLRLILLFTLASLLVITAESFRAQEPEDPRAGALNRLRKDSAQPPTIHFEASIPHFVSVHVPVPSNTPDDPVIRALDFLAKYRDLYLLWDPRSQLFLDHIVRNELGQHVFFGQRRDEVPVFAAEIAVHLSKDAIIGTNCPNVPNTGSD